MILIVKSATVLVQSHIADSVKNSCIVVRGGGKEGGWGERQNWISLFVYSLKADRCRLSEQDIT